MKIFMGSRKQPVHKAHKLATIYEPTRQCGILNILQPYKPPWPVKGQIYFFIYFTTARAQWF
jgi:hypothetical protein